MKILILHTKWWNLYLIKWKYMSGLRNTIMWWWWIFLEVCLSINGPNALSFNNMHPYSLLAKRKTYAGEYHIHRVTAIDQRTMENGFWQTNWEWKDFAMFWELKCFPFFFTLTIHRLSIGFRDFVKKNFLFYRKILQFHEIIFIWY